MPARLSTARNKAFSARSAHCIQKVWSTRRKRDRANKCRRTEGDVLDSDWFDEEDDTEQVAYDPDETNVWEDDLDAHTPRIVLPSAISRYSVAFGPAESTRLSVESA